MNEADGSSVLLELKSLLQRLQSSELPQLADIRRVEELRRGIQHRDDVSFFVIRATVSDLDTVPDEGRRHLFADAFLKAKDEECASYLSAAADDLRRGAAALLASSWLRAES